MMTETFKNTETPIIPVIGIGVDSKKYIDEIKGRNTPSTLSNSFSVLFGLNMTDNLGKDEFAIYFIATEPRKS